MLTPASRVFSAAVAVLVFCGICATPFGESSADETPAPQSQQGTETTTPISESSEAEEATGDAESSVEEDATYLDEVVVVANRQQEHPFQTPRSVGVVSEQDLAERSPRTVPEALWDSPGVFVQQTNHGGGSPILRGMIGPQNLILVDGVRFNNSTWRTGPVQYLNLIDPLSIERIEVLRGPGSVLYGSDAMGGVINVFPARSATGNRRMETELLLRHGSADQEKTAHAQVQGTFEGTSMLGAVTAKSFGDLRAGRDVGVQRDSSYDALSGLATLSHNITEGALRGWSAKASYLVSQIEDAGRTDKLYDKHSLQIYDNSDHLAYGRLHARLAPLKTDAELTLSYHRSFERKDAHTVGEDFHIIEATTRDETSVDTLGVDLQLDSSLFAERVRLFYGGMWYRDLVDADRQGRGDSPPWMPSREANYPEGSTYDNMGGFITALGDLVSTEDGHVLRLSGGYRLHGMAASAPARDQLPAVEFSQIGHVFFSGLEYLVAESFTLAATFSQGFRAPNLNEAVMLGDTGKYFHVPNHDLRPERSDTFELLARGRVWRLWVSCSGYVSLLDALIKREESTWDGLAEVDGKDVAWNINGGEGLLWGLEGELGADLGAGFVVENTISYTWGEELVSGGAGVPLTRIPPLFGATSLRYETPGGRAWHGFATTSIRWASSQERLSAEDVNDVRIPDGGTPGWWTWNVSLGVVPAEWCELTLRAENLLDKTYKYHGSGLYSAGTNVSLTATAWY